MAVHAAPVFIVDQDPIKDWLGAGHQVHIFLEHWQGHNFQEANLQQIKIRPETLVQPLHLLSMTD